MKEERRICPITTLQQGNRMEVYFLGSNLHFLASLFGYREILWGTPWIDKKYDMKRHFPRNLVHAAGFGRLGPCWEGGSNEKWLVSFFPFIYSPKFVLVCCISLSVWVATSRALLKCASRESNRELFEKFPGVCHREIWTNGQPYKHHHQLVKLQTSVDTIFGYFLHYIFYAIFLTQKSVGKIVTSQTETFFLGMPQTHYKFPRYPPSNQKLLNRYCEERKVSTA